MSETLQPLSTFAVHVLQEIKRRPLLRRDINAGVCARLEAEGLIEIDNETRAKIPKKNAMLQSLRITPAGEQRLAEAKAGAQ